MEHESVARVPVQARAMVRHEPKRKTASCRVHRRDLKIIDRSFMLQAYAIRKTSTALVLLSCELKPQAPPSPRIVSSALHSPDPNIVVDHAFSTKDTAIKYRLLGRHYSSSLHIDFRNHLSFLGSNK